jgi:hypothetical protein
VNSDPAVTAQTEASSEFEFEKSDEEGCADLLCDVSKDCAFPLSSL